MQDISKKIIRPTTKIGILIYDGFDSLDVAGPNQVFYFFEMFGNGQHYLIGPEKGKIVTSLEGLKWQIDLSYDDITEDLDVLFVPGGVGPGFEALLKNKDEQGKSVTGSRLQHLVGFKNLFQNAGNKYDPFYTFLQNQVSSAQEAYENGKRARPQLVCSVCTGALLLARAGLLDGYACTTHWAFKNVLSLFPAVSVAPGFPRYVIDRNRISGGGISSGLDEALAIVEILGGPEIARQIQLAIQYAPNPPVTSGDPGVADASTLFSVSEKLDTTELYNEVKQWLGGAT